MEPLTRTQILLAMGFTALVLLAAAKLWMYFGSVDLMTWNWRGSAFPRRIGDRQCDRSHERLGLSGVADLSSQCRFLS